MDIKHDLTIKASAATVYNAVATQQGINGWWSKTGTVGASEGDTSVMIFDKQGTKVEMGFRTETLIPNQEVVWECIKNGNPAWLKTKIRTTIHENDGECQVTFSHTGFDEKWAGHDAFEMTKGTWQHFVESLVSYCERGEGQPW